MNLIASTGKPIPPDLEEKLRTLANMKPGERFEVLTDLATHGFVIDVRIRWQDDNVFESVSIQTDEEYERGKHSS